MSPPFLTWGRYGTCVWFRIFGKGINVRPAKGYQPYFSERAGYRKAYYFLGLRLEFLK